MRIAAAMDVAANVAVAMVETNEEMIGTESVMNTKYKFFSLKNGPKW